MKKFFQNLKPSTGGTNVKMSPRGIELLKMALTILGASSIILLVVWAMLALISSGLTDILDSYAANGAVSYVGIIKLLGARVLGKMMALRTTVNTEA